MVGTYRRSKFLYLCRKMIEKAKQTIEMMQDLCDTRIHNDGLTQEIRDRFMDIHEYLEGHWRELEE